MQKKYKKIVIINILFFCIIVLSLSVFYYLSFFLPLKSNDALFPENFESTNEQSVENIVQRRREENNEEKYGITIEESLYNKAYFIDGREPEEFQHSHIKEAKHTRAPDIKNANDIKDIFGLTDKKFQESFFVIYCHDGRRSSDVVSFLKTENVKFLIGGINDLFNNDKIDLISGKSGKYFKHMVKDRNFFTTPDQSIELIKKENANLIDGRLFGEFYDGTYDDYNFPQSFVFRISELSIEKYNEKLEQILNFENKNIIYIAETNADLFYAKLLIHRLYLNYNWDLDKYHILFRQGKELKKILENKQL